MTFSPAFGAVLLFSAITATASIHPRGTDRTPSREGSSVVPSMPAFSRWYPVEMRSCDDNAGDALGLLWSFNQTNGKNWLQFAAATRNCLVAGPPNGQGAPVMDICVEPWTNYSHYPTFEWNETVGTFQHHNSPWCLGYTGSTVTMFNCSNYNGTSKTFDRVMQNTTTEYGAPIFKLRSPLGLCVGTQRRFTESAELKSDQWRVVFGVNGINNEANFTYMQSLQVWQPTLNSWSMNFLHSNSAPMEGLFSMTSITSLDPSSGGRVWSHATGGYFQKVTKSEIIIADIRVGDVALEKWTISVVKNGTSASTLGWKVDRTYLKTISEESSRYPTINLLKGWLTVGESSVDQQAQFASTLDNSFQWNHGTASGFKFHVGCTAGDGNYDGCDGVTMPWFFSNSRKQRHWISLSPSDLCIPWEKSVRSSNAPHLLNDSSVNFTMQWTNHGGMEAMAIGLLSTNKLPISISAGTNVSTSLSFAIDTSSHDACKAVHRLTFTTGNEHRDKNTRAMARLFNMWAGNMLGNSPTSSVCLFESSMFALIASVFDPPPPAPEQGASTTNTAADGNNSSSRPPLPDLFEALRFEYGFFLEHMVDPATGAVASDWEFSGPGAGYGSNMWQQQTSLLHGIYVYATTTGDKEFMQQYWELEQSNGTKVDGPLKKALGFMLHNMGLAEDGLLHCLGASTGSAHPKSSCNWLDIVGFGHYDAIVNSEAAMVLQGYADAAAWLGDNATATMLTALWKKNVMTYNAMLWNETLGLYSDWIGEDGTRHSYGYIWQQGNAANMASGIVGNNQTRLAQMCDSVDSLYKYMWNSTNTTKERIFATPTNFISVPDLYQVAWDQPPLVYENGALFTVQVQFEMQLRYACQQPDRALKLYDKILLDQFEHFRCWGQRYSWAPGWQPNPVWTFGDVLTDSAMIIVGLLRGGFKVRPTLTQGLIVDGHSGTEYEGWTWTFYYMGERVTATVKDGKTVITPAE